MSVTRHLMQFFPPRPARALLVLALVSALTVLSAPIASAQDTALGTAEESAIAVPFTGSYEVWCTDRNPAPGNRCSRHHGSPAIDIGMDPGVPLHATGAGVVTDADSNCPARGACNNGMGNNVIISHSDGTFSRYLHLQDVDVSVDEVVVAGQRIGTSGESGQYSSPHLHYDEHFPYGTRTDMGTWVGCVDGEQVLYPESFGVTDWNDVPYGSVIRNDDFSCLEGVTIDSVSAPRILPGSTHFGVTPPTELTKTWFEIRVADGQTESTTAMSGTSLLLLPAPSESAEISIRQLVEGQWTTWSSAYTYTPAPDTGAPTCAGLYASTSSSVGTPDADVMIGSIYDDEINARGGDDVVCTLAGNDSILAGPGKDLVFSGVGDDTVRGGRGADIIFAEAGADNVRGGDGPDQIHGGSGDDIVHGTAGNDMVDGGNGDDHVIGGIGHDRVKGSADNDTIEGRNGRDVLLGGNGDDILAGGNGLDRLVGGAGTDRLDGQAGSDRCVTADNDELVACER